jgi:hypothetical protein
MATQVHQGFMVTITNVYTAADGSPGVLDGIPVWSASIPAIATLTPSADGLSCGVAWNGTGLVTISSLADGDLGTGIFAISDSFDLEMVAPLGATAVVGSISAEVLVV